MGDRAKRKKLIFVSHRETDKQVAAALVEYLLSSLAVDDNEVRCTSVPGHQLPFGTTISEQLKDDLSTSSCIIALLTPQSIKSTWVLFELGSAWATGKVIVPVLGPGLKPSDLPGPLSGYPGVQITDAGAGARLRDATKQIARGLNVAEKTGGKAEAKLNHFVESFKAWAADYGGAKGPLRPRRPLSAPRLDFNFQAHGDKYYKNTFNEWGVVEVLCVMHGLDKQWSHRKEDNIAELCFSRKDEIALTSDPILFQLDDHDRAIASKGPVTTHGFYLHYGKDDGNSALTLQYMVNELPSVSVYWLNPAMMHIFESRVSEFVGDYDDNAFVRPKVSSMDEPEAPPHTPGQPRPVGDTEKPMGPRRGRKKS